MTEAKLNIAKAKDGRNILYDINKIKNIGRASLPLSAEQSQQMGSLTISNVDGSISQKGPAVNTSNNKKRQHSVEDVPGVADTL